MFAIHGNRLPSAHSYAQACSVWERAEPMKDSLWRGLVNKREGDKIVIKEADGRVRFRYHSTDLVTWVDEKTIEVKFWDSISSGIFTNRFLPVGMDAITSRSNMAIVTRSGTYENATSAPMRFLRGEADVWTPENLDDVLTFETYRVDRKKANAVRRRLKAWTDWRDPVARLRGPVPEAIKSWRAVDGQEIDLLQRYVAGEDIPFKVLYEQPLMHSPALEANALILGDAVMKVQLPVGTPRPRPSPYTGLPAWA